MNTFLRLSRSYFTHYFWEEPRTYSRAEAWLDLLRTAAIQPTTRLVHGNPVRLTRGTLIASVRYLAARWQWSNTKVCHFLENLRAEQMITTEKRHHTTLITLCNYDHYNPLSFEKNDTETPTKRRRHATPNPSATQSPVPVVDPNHPPLSPSPSPISPSSHAEPPPQNSSPHSDLRLPTSDLASPAPFPTSDLRLPTSDLASPPVSNVASPARPDSMAEVVDYLRTLGLPPTDGEYLWETWQASGWTRAGHPIKDWRAATRAWKAASYLPSQKQTQKRHPQKPGPVTALHDPTGTIASQY
ncbi:hypothetical protein BH09VER1_BH09VER1_44170 [soil metagenome]